MNIKSELLRRASSLFDGGKKIKKKLQASGATLAGNKSVHPYIIHTYFASGLLVRVYVIIIQFIIKVCSGYKKKLGSGESLHWRLSFLT